MVDAATPKDQLETALLKNWGYLISVTGDSASITVDNRFNPVRHLERARERTGRTSRAAQLLRDPARG